MSHSGVLNSHARGPASAHVIVCPVETWHRARRLLAGAVGLLAFGSPGVASSQEATTRTAAAPSGDSAKPIAPTVGTFREALDALFNHPAGLTSDAAAARSRMRSSEVAAKRADEAAAQAGTRDAALRFLPTLGARGSYARLSDVGSQALGAFAAAPASPLGPLTPGAPLVNQPLAFTVPRDMYSIQADVSLPVSDLALRLASKYAGAKHSARAAELTTRATERAVAAQARLTYYAWIGAETRRVVAESSLALARQQAADVEARARAGELSEADVLQTRSRVSEVELAVERARNAANSKADELRTTLHGPPGESYEIGETLWTDVPPFPGQADLEGLVAEAIRERLELRALSEGVAHAKSEAFAARTGVLPRLDLVGSAVYANPNTRYFPLQPTWHATWAVGGALSWNSGDALSGAAGGAAAGAQASHLEADLDALRDAVRAEVVRGHEAVRNAESAVTSMDKSLAAEEEVYRVRRALFRSGQSSLADLNEAENRLTRTRLAAVQARIDLRVARVALLHAVGRDR